MEKIKKIVSKYISTDLPIRLCIFNMMSVIGILGGTVSIATTYIMKMQNGQVIYMAAAIVLLVFLMYMANSLKKLNLAAILLCSVIGIGMFPMMFIRGGGIYSGMTLWFVLVIVFVAILIAGWFKYVMGIFMMVLYSGLIYFAHQYPDAISYFENDDMVFMDIGQSLVFVSICVLCIIAFQMHRYDLAYKRAEDAAREAERAMLEAEAANAAKSNFLASMSHEIRTPIGVITGMNEMIQRESAQESIIDYSNDVTSAANSLMSIINDILDFSKIESGKMNIVETEYELQSLINDLLDVAHIKREQTGLIFETKIDDSLPSKLSGDDIRIKQCVLNILTNAFKYTEKGRIVMDISGEREADYVLITFSVSDTGQGIKEEDLERLFESFVRLNEQKNRSIQGTGLGLNITNSLLNLMGSKLEVESTFNEGSRFFFTIKQGIVDEMPLSSIKAEASKIRDDAEEGFVAPDARILVVDDSKINLKVFCSLLKRTQIQIDTAISGEVSIDMVRNNRYDMIFMDHMMPGMDGVETLEKMRKENILGDTPMIMLTANAIVGMKEIFLEAGFDDYLSKPILFGELEDILRKYL